MTLILLIIFSAGMGIESVTTVYSDYIPNEKVHIYFSAADGVVQPYVSATQSAIAQMAYFFSSPIIATNVGGTREIISGNNDGYLTQPKNIEQLKDKLSDLIDHPEKRLVFGQNAYQAVKSKFSWDHATDQYLEVFSKLLENRKK